MDKFFEIHSLGFGARLKQEREKSGLSLAELATLGGVNRVTQTRYECEDSHPTVEYLAKLSTCLDMHFVLTGARFSDRDVVRDFETLSKAIDLVDGLATAHNFNPTSEFRGRAVMRLYERIRTLGSRNVKPNLEELLHAGSAQI